jgi:hypothetical protein
MAETLGNTQILATAKMIGKDGRPVSVPVISGNSIRHHLRAALVDQMLRATGLDGATLSQNALRFLYAGGQLTKDDGKKVKISAYRELCEVVPALGLFGGAIGGRLESGRLSAFDAKLVCTEAAHIIPSWISETLRAQNHEIVSCRAQVEEVQRVGMASMLPSTRRPQLTSADQAQVDADREAGNHEWPMPYSYQTVVAGSLWSWKVEAECWTPVEVDAVHIAVAGWLARGVVGGKVASGAGGHLRPLQTRYVTLPDLEPRRESKDLSTDQIGGIFRASMSNRARDLAEFLGSL